MATPPASFLSAREHVVVRNEETEISRTSTSPFCFITQNEMELATDRTNFLRGPHLPWAMSLAALGRDMITQTQRRKRNRLHPGTKQGC